MNINEFAQVWGMVGLFALNIMVPGVNFIWITKMSMDHGRLSGWFASLGCTLGDMIYATLSLLGISALIAGRPLMLSLIATVGGLWLFYSGARMMWLSKAIELEHEAEQANLPCPWTKAIRLGLLVNLTNAQGIIFFSAVLGTGFSGTPGAGHVGLLLGGILAASLLIRGGIAWFFALEKIRIAYAGSKKAMGMISGGALLIFGLKTSVQYAPVLLTKAHMVLMLAI